MDGNQADIYNQKKVQIPQPKKEVLRFSREKLEGMLKSLDAKRNRADKNIKEQILDKTNRNELEAMLKQVRRREYYHKRVKKDFA